ncbi:polysaccharide deacetylase family protein [Candidatus Peregrinibacteria bacterium]|nr:polysaccharide deacetylase family protein [Candidatus Peregrinibacteria bacterium]
MLKRLLIALLILVTGTAALIYGRNFLVQTAPIKDSALTATIKLPDIKIFQRTVAPEGTKLKMPIDAGIFNAGTLWVPVIVYHHIGTAPSNLSSADQSMFIKPEWFEKHVKYLKDNGFETIHFSDLDIYFNKGTPLPVKRPVIISFDDGNGTGYTKAFPILQKYGMTGTYFVITNYVGHGSHLTWDQIKEMGAAGMEIGSHTLSHPFLTKSLRLKEELVQSKKILEDNLGVTISTFAYPYGIYDEKTVALAKEAGYTTARSFTTGNGISTGNLFEIPVVRIYANIGLDRWNKQLFASGKPE